MLTIALDVMGGDFGVDVLLPAAGIALSRHPHLKVILVGDEDRIRARLRDVGDGHERSVLERVEVQHASQVVGSDEAPALAMRSKKDSSMRVAIDMVKQGRAQACVSAGNTGALMATSRFVLKTLAGIDRPAICSAVPSVNGHTWVLDLGANVDCSAEHLVQFAVMGSELARAVDGNKQPRVALLNIGSEDIKGNAQVKQAAQLLAQSAEADDINYVGYAEGDDIYLGDVDVVVCDGFIGNVALKTSEGVARMITQALKSEFTADGFSKLSGVLAFPVLKRLRKTFDPRRYNGGSLVGLRGNVIKSHGGADKYAVATAIYTAMKVVEQDLVAHIAEHVERHTGG